jgi:WD40 repeat protein
VASSSDDGTVRLWDLVSHRSRVLGTQLGSVGDVTFSPDGQTLAAASRDGDIRLWDVASGEGRSLVGHEVGVEQVEFSPDGRTIASAGLDHTVRLWRNDLPDDPVSLRRWFDAVTNARLGTDNQVHFGVTTADAGPPGRPRAQPADAGVAGGSSGQ